MANKFQITISAVDRATAVVRRINTSMARLTRPVGQVMQSVRGLAREAGLDKLGLRLQGVGRAAVDTGGKIGALAAPLGVLVGGGVLAGITALTLEWSRLGGEIDRTARSLGMQSAELQSLRGAAGLAGVGAEELSGGLKSLGDTLEDALYGRNQEALVVLNRLGIGIRHTADGSIDAASAMRDLSGAIAGVKNAQVQGVIARTFGLEAVLPLLRQGPAAIEAYERKVAELGGVMGRDALRGADEFQLSLHYLQIAGQGVRNEIGAKLMPILQPMIDKLTGWTAANRELIATKVADFVGGLAQRVNELDFNRLGDDIHSLIEGIDTVVDSVGGWKNAAVGLVLLMNGPLIASVLNLGGAFIKLGGAALPVVIRGIGLLSAAAPAVMGALSGVAGSFLSAGAAMMATPIGWIVAGIAAIAVGAYAIYKNWDDIGTYFSRKIEAVRSAFEKSWTGGVVKMLWEFSPTKIIADAMNGLSKWLFDFDLYDAGRGVVGSLVRGMKSVATLLPSALQKRLGIEGWAQPVAAAVAPVQAAVATGATAAPTAVASPAQRAVQTSAQPLGIRNNNPGNLRRWGDTPRDARGYAVFPTMEAGLSAAVRNLVTQQTKHGLNTISGIISKWAPPTENNTAAYISALSRSTGFAADQPLNLSDPKVVAPLISGIVRQEGNSAGVTEELISRVVQAQLAGASSPSAGNQKVEVALTLHGLPAGTGASARNRGGEPMPVRVAYTMPTGVTP